ncbi:MAG: hypothetical protein FWG52_09575 [Proteobacteria bacterium]|nr:hypothetical protein [Pseudomonadota bacterium]
MSLEPVDGFSRCQRAAIEGFMFAIDADNFFGCHLAHKPLQYQVKRIDRTARLEYFLIVAKKQNIGGCRQRRSF